MFTLSYRLKTYLFIFECRLTYYNKINILRVLAMLNIPNKIIHCQIKTNINILCMSKKSISWVEKKVVGFVIVPFTYAVNNTSQFGHLEGWGREKLTVSTLTHVPWAVQEKRKHERVNGGYSFRRRRNEAEEKVLDFTLSYDFALINTYYRKSQEQFITIKSWRNMSQFDYFMWKRVRAIK